MKLSFHADQKNKFHGKLFEKRDNSNTVFTHNVILNMKSFKEHYIVRYILEQDGNR